MKNQCLLFCWMLHLPREMFEIESVETREPSFCILQTRLTLNIISTFLFMFSLPPTNNHLFNEELMFIICWMLHPEVGFRAKLPDIIKYPWFTREVDINNYDYDTVLAGMCECFIYFSRKKIISPRWGYQWKIPGRG